MRDRTSVRWLAAALAGIAIGMFASPGTASAPPAGAPVRILDATDGSRVAHVDADGNLQVGGTVGIESSTPLATTSLDDPGRTVFQAWDRVIIHDGEASAVIDFGFPANARLVITQVSGNLTVQGGQDPSLVLQVGAGGLSFHNFIAELDPGTTGEDVYTFSQETLIFDDGPNVIFTMHRFPDAFDAAFSVAVSGYLIDCSAAECN